MVILYRPQKKSATISMLVRATEIVGCASAKVYSSADGGGGGVVKVVLSVAEKFWGLMDAMFIKEMMCFSLGIEVVR